MADKQYDNEGRFVLFKNKPKEGGSDKQPQYRGSFQLGGVEYDLSGWITHPKAGGEGFISGQLRPREAREVTTTFDDGLGTSSDESKPEFSDDDIPF